MDQMDQTDLTLMDLMNSLNFGMSKAAEAEECESEDDKKEKSEGKDDKEDKNDKMPEQFKKKDDKAESKDEDDEKEEDGQTKSASELGASMAREIMEKAASMKTTPTQAQIVGNTLADALLKQLQKQANAGDMTTADGVSPGAVANKPQIDNAQMTAEDDSKIKPMPTSDGLRPTGTVNEIFDAMVADTLAQGAASAEQVHETGVTKQEGAVNDHAVPNQVKVAHVTNLMNQGVDFESAVSMVKEAADELEDDLEKAAAVQYLVEVEGLDFEKAAELIQDIADEMIFEKVTLQKRAQMDYLLSEGFDFDEAVELVKQANAGDMVTVDGISPGAVPNKPQVDNAQMVAEDDAKIQLMQTSDGLRPTGTINEIFDAIVDDALAQGAAGTEQVHETGVSAPEGAVLDHAVPNQVKVAKLNELVAQGVDFAEAAAIVKEAALKSPKAFKGMVGAAKDLAVASGKWVGRAAATKGREAAGAAHALVNPGIHAGSGMRNSTIRREAAKSLAKNPLVLGGAAATAAGAGGAYAASHSKKAALDSLIAEGYDYDTAVELVKEAALKSPKAFMGMVGAAKDLAVAGGKWVGRAAATKGREAAGAAQALINPAVAGAGSGMRNSTIRREAAKSLAKNPLVLGGAAATAAGGAAMAHKKHAALEALVAQGVDFNQAAEMVTAKAQELFGE